MKLKHLTISAAILLISLAAKAGEGMWLPNLISQRILDMQANGCRLSAEDIYSVNQASLKDAVVLFGSGCTGELISGEGLLITNHHCGYGQIQQHSSVEHDYLKDGFWAMKRSEELPNPGLTVKFLERMEDVTDIILKGWDANMSETERAALVKANSSALAKEVTAEGNGLKASVEALYYGNTYYLFVYREYRDVRLVGAPPSSIGKFGGDTDNWMWPRHTGDFSMFRVYADKNNNPADYSEDNVPYTPKKFLKISRAGVQEGDFTMVYGFPGSTMEYISSREVKFVAETLDPQKVALRTLRLDIQKKYMDADRAVKIMYSSKNARVANAWKKWQGELLGVNRNKIVARKEAYEADFEKWAKGTEYEGITAKINDICAQEEPYLHAKAYYSECANAIEMTSFARNLKICIAALAGAEGGKAADVLEKYCATLYKDWFMPIDKESAEAVMTEFGKYIPEDMQPAYYKENIRGQETAWADMLFSSSLLAGTGYIDSIVAELRSAPDADAVKEISGKASEAISGDPAYIFAEAFRTWSSKDINPVANKLNAEKQLLMRTYMRGQIAFEKDRTFYPDANLTLRVTYGKVSGYSPKDGVTYLASSTLDGIIEKDNPEIFDYNIPQRLRDIHAAKDYGTHAVNGTIPVCFLGTNHTTGGNSGSPVLNADGHLIGLNFDRVWEGTMSDIAYDPSFCRNITLDIRYALFLIDRLAGASHLLEEMEFVD